MGGEGLENRVAIGKGGKLVLREDLTRVKEKVSEFFEQINGSHESRIALIKDIYSAFDIIRPKLHYMLNIDSHIKYALERLSVFDNVHRKLRRMRCDRLTLRKHGADEIARVDDILVSFEKANQQNAQHGETDCESGDEMI